MELIEYPVSAVMKLWHMALTAAGMSDAPAWSLSIALLVLTVRLFLIPFAYRAYRATRVLVNLRPALAALEDEYHDKLSPRDRSEKSKKRRELQKDNGYRIRDGCFPALIQIPFFIGLYRILLQVARPSDLEAATHPGIGALSGEDISHFIDADIFGIPLAAYSTMSDEQFAFLGTTSADVFRFALPLCITAAVFTTLNMAYSIRRNWMTLDVNNGFARGTYRMMFFMAPMAILVPLVFGLAGPAPAAIMCYWVMNNLWTMVQNVSLHLILDRQIPYSEEFQAHRREVGEQRKVRLAESRDARVDLGARSRERRERIRELAFTMRHSGLPEERDKAAHELDEVLTRDTEDKKETDLVVRKDKHVKAERKKQARILRQQAAAANRKAKAEAAAAEKEEDAASEEGADGAVGADAADTGTPAAVERAPEDAPADVPEPAPAAPPAPPAPSAPSSDAAPSAPYRGRHRLDN